MRNNRLSNRKGFTMAELLIVVAIIAVLVAVAVPIFQKKKEKANETVDISVMRSAASLGQQFYYSGVVNKATALKAGMAWYNSGSESNVGSNAFAVYLPQTGTFSAGYNNTIKPYGKGNTLDGGVDIFAQDGKPIYDPTIDYTNAVCQVAIYPNGTNKRIEVAWKILTSTDPNGRRPFAGNGKRGKYGYNYTEATYPRLTIPLE